MTFVRKDPVERGDLLGRAELRMLQEALKASMEVQTEGLTPVKSNDGENDSYLPTYNKLLEAQGKSAMKALTVMLKIFLRPSTVMVLVF